MRCVRRTVADVSGVLLPVLRVCVVTDAPLRQVSWIKPTHVHDVGVIVSYRRYGWAGMEYLIYYGWTVAWWASFVIAFLGMMFKMSIGTAVAITLNQ